MRWFYDAVIFGFLILDTLGIILLLTKGTSILPQGLNRILAITAIFAFGVIAYGSFVEPRRLLVRSELLTLNEHPSDAMNIVLISDIHVGPYKGREFVQQIVDTINEIHPEAVLLAGDFVENEADQAIALAPLGDISQVYPIYAVLGNHDYQLGADSDPADEETGKGVTARLASLGVNVLDNAGTPIHDGDLWLAGIDEIWADRADVHAALADRKADAKATILLVHNPDIIKSLTPEERIDLVLAGHTHGGQIRLPYFGPVPQLPTELGEKYDRGLFTIGGTKLFITSGAGESGPRARLFNPPEIVVLTIQY